MENVLNTLYISGVWIYWTQLVCVIDLTICSLPSDALMVRGGMASGMQTGSLERGRVSLCCHCCHWCSIPFACPFQSVNISSNYTSIMHTTDFELCPYISPTNTDFRAEISNRTQSRQQWNQSKPDGCVTWVSINFPLSKRKNIERVPFWFNQKSLHV